MLPRDQIENAVEIQRKSYKLLLSLVDAIDGGFITFTRTHEYANAADAAHEWIDEYHANLPEAGLASFKNSNRKSARQRGQAILIALFILLSAAPQSSIASLVIMLYHNEILYIASDSALTSVENGKRIGSVKKTFTIAENCCVAMTGSAAYDIETVSGKPFASLNFLKLLEKLMP